MRLIPFLTAIALSVTAAAPAIAQSQFSPAIMVNDSAITGFQLEQRRKLLELFRTPGNLTELAREQLIEERLKQAEMDRRGLRITEETLATEVNAFAARANLTTDQFINMLSQNGVALQTLEDFVEIGVTWRDYIRLRFGSSATVSDAEVDRAMSQSNRSSTVEVLLSEIIIPAPPPEAARATAIANQISQTTSQGQFEAAARQYSALPSRENGGRLGWLPITNYPPALQGVILDLSIGEVTAPLSIPNGVALFQVRGIREIVGAAATPTAIDYAALYLPGGKSQAGLQAAANLKARVDTCDDLYGAARGLPENVLDRRTVSASEIPQDVALELARLDRDEVSFNLTRENGSALMFLMLCNRTSGDPATIDREGVRNQLRSQRLSGFADALLADLRAAATITP